MHAIQPQNCLDLSPAPLPSSTMSASDIWRYAIFGFCHKEHKDHSFRIHCLGGSILPPRHLWDTYFKQLIGDDCWLDQIKLLCLLGLKLRRCDRQRRLDAFAAFCDPDIDIELARTFDYLG